jgi:glucuronosyltransferase
MFFSDCLLPGVHKLNAPFGYLSPAGPFMSIQGAMGNHPPLSFVPYLILPFSDHMSFHERLMNLITHLTMTGFFGLYLDVEADEFGRDVFGPGLPTVAELRKNASFAVLNTGVAQNPPAPYLPGIIEAGGMHCVPAKHLPKVHYLLRL